MTTAVLVIDMIKDFVKGELENERARRIIPNINNLLESARATNKPIIYVCDSHPEDDPEFALWGKHAVAGSEGSEIVSELEPKEDDYTLEKSKYSAFFDTGLDFLLEELNADTVVLTGVLTHICIQHTAADAFYRSYEIIVPVGCVEDTSEENNQKALEFIEANYGANIIDFQEIMGRWQKDE